MKLLHCSLALLITCLPIFASTGVLAQQLPSAGNQLLQIPALRPSPAPEPEARTKTDVQRPASRDDAGKVVVAGIRFHGAKAVPEATLIQASGFSSGQTYKLGELRELAARVTSHYRAQGFFLAQTYLPTQDITDGVVHFNVVEGDYGTIKLNNQSRLSDAVANNLLDSLRGTGAVAESELERRLLILSDLPGIYAKSVLTPGAIPGTTDLRVDITNGRAVGGAFDADNFGNRYTGANRAGASVFYNEPTGLGDLATARVLTSGEGLTYGQVAYQAQLGWVSLGVSYASLQYKLLGEFSSVKSSGTARVSSLYLNYPWVRSRDRNLSIQGSSDFKEFSDLTEFGNVGTSSDKSARLLTATVRGDFKDSGAQASGDYALTWTHGEMNLYDPVARFVDSLSANSQGGFDKVTFAFRRNQAVSSTSQLYASVNAQWASKNLDASEKFGLGGANGVRAFPAGEATGDEGVLLTLELRTRMPVFEDQMAGKLQFITFLDAGMINVNKALWEPDSGGNRRNLSGAGLGISYAGAEKLIVRGYYAYKLGSESAVSTSDAKGRFWLEINKSF